MKVKSYEYVHTTYFSSAMANNNAVFLHTNYEE